jgi:two-component system sensor kinase FixL
MDVVVSDKRVGDSRFFETLMDAAVDAIIIIDHKGIIRRFNHSAQHLFGYEEQEVVGQNLKILMPEPARDQHDGYLAKYLETGKAAIIGIGREVKGQRKNGECFPMRLSVGESRHEDSIQFVGIVHDLSSRHATDEKLKLLEQQLFHADRLLTLGELTAGIAHEINQPLTAIAAYADAGRQLLDKENRAAGSPIDKICSRISEQSRRAAEVVKRLRKLVRSGTTSRLPHDVKKIVDNTLVLFDYELSKTGISLQVHYPEVSTEVFVDEIQIQQILVNLVKNSMDSILESAQKIGKIDIFIEQDESELSISVQDNGPGVSEENLPNLFAPFYTSKPKGVGLGLSICKHIAAAHGGHLTYIQSGQPGAKFTLSLPLTFIG